MPPVAIMCGPISLSSATSGAIRGTVCGTRDCREPLITDAESISISHGFTTCDAGRPAVAKAAHLALRLPGKPYELRSTATSHTCVSCTFIQCELCVYEPRTLTWTGFSVHEAIEAGNRNKLTDGRLLIILFHSLSFYKKILIF